MDRDVGARLDHPRGQHRFVRVQVHRGRRGRAASPARSEAARPVAGRSEIGDHLQMRPVSGVAGEIDVAEPRADDEPEPQRAFPRRTVRAGSCGARARRRS